MGEIKQNQAACEDVALAPKIHGKRVDVAVLTGEPPIKLPYGGNASSPDYLGR